MEKEKRTNKMEWISRFLPHPIPEVYQDALMVACHVHDLSDPTMMSIQIVSELTELRKLLLDMRLFYEEGDGGSIPALTSVSAGTPVALQSPDGEFLRAEVLEGGRGMARVSCVDTGTVENVSLSHIRPLDLKFLQVPRFAVECSVANWQPDWFQELVNAEGEMEQFTAHFVGTNSDGRCVLWLGSAGRRRQNSMEESPEGTEEIWDRITGAELWKKLQEAGPAPGEASLPPTLFRKRFQRLPPNLLIGKTLDVSLQDIENPGRFTVTVCDLGFRGSLMILLTAMNEYYTTLDGDRFSSFHVDEACAAKYMDGKWYRACVVEPPSANRPAVLVRFVDFGNTCLVDLHSMRILEERFLELYALSVPCQLLHASPLPPLTAWPRNASQYLSQFLESDLRCEFLGEMQDGVFQVEITLPPSNQRNDLPVSLRTRLRNTGLAAPYILEEEDEERRAGCLERPQIAANFSAKIVRPVFIKSPDLFYIHFPKDMSLLKDVTSTVERHYADGMVGKQKLKPPIPVGTPCVAFNPETSCWNRGEVLDVRESGILVLESDFGVEFWARPEDVCKMKHMDILWLTPVLAIPCRLHGIKGITEEWPVDTVSTLKGLISRGVECKFRDRDSGGINRVELHLPSGESIPDILLHRNMAVIDDSLAEKNRSTMKYSVSVVEGSVKWQVPGLPDLDLNTRKEGGQLDVISSFVDKDSCIYFQAKGNKEAIFGLSQELMFQRDGDGSVHLPLLNNPKPGDLCLAEYSLDGRYYRALILAERGDSAFTVYFVDYGNREEVFITGIFQMDALFRDYPPFAFPCYLSGVPWNEKTSQLLNDKIAFSALVSNFTIRTDKMTEGGGLEVTLEFEDAWKTRFSVNRILSGTDAMPSLTPPHPVIHQMSDTPLEPPTDASGERRSKNGEAEKGNGEWSGSKEELDSSADSMDSEFALILEEMTMKEELAWISSAGDGGSVMETVEETLDH